MTKKTLVIDMLQGRAWKVTAIYMRYLRDSRTAGKMSLQLYNDCALTVSGLRSQANQNIQDTGKFSCKEYEAKLKSAIAGLEKKYNR